MLCVSSYLRAFFRRDEYVRHCMMSSFRSSRSGEAGAGCGSAGRVDCRKFRFWRGGRIGSALLPALLLLAVSGESWAQTTLTVLIENRGTNVRVNTMIVNEGDADALSGLNAYIGNVPASFAGARVEFNLENGGDTATWNVDYGRGGSSPRFAGTCCSFGALRAALRTTILEDMLDDDDEFFTITASSGAFPPGTVIVPARITIIDNDDASIDLSLSQTTVVEGSGVNLVSEITVTAEHQGSVPASATEVVISVVGDGTNAATAADFTAPSTSLTVTIPANMASGTGVLTLTVIGDRVDEEDETLTVSGTAEGYGGTITPTTLTIEDDDVAGVTIAVTNGDIVNEVEGEIEVNVDEGDALEYTIVLDSDPGPGGTVRVTHDQRTGTRSFIAFGGVFVNTFTSSGVNRWSRPRVVSARTPRDSDAVDDTVFQDHTVSGYAGVMDADVVNIKVNIIDDGTPGLIITPNPLTVFEGGTDPYQYTVRFQHQLVADATVKPVVGASESAGITVSPASLTFTPANGNTNQTFTVTVADDADASDATLIVGHTITGYPEFTDPTRAELTVMVVDDEESPTNVLLELVTPTAVVAETDADAERTITLRVSLDPADSGLLAAPTEVVITVADGTTNPATVGANPATAGTDITPVPLTITIPAGARTMTAALTLTVVGDRVAEGTETVMVSGTATSDGTTLPVNAVTLQVLDNDSPTVTLSADPVSESVAGGMVTVTATADLALPGGFSVGVLITGVTATEGEDYTALGATRLTFAGTPAEEETFTVEILSDRVDEGAGETFMVSLISLMGNAQPVTTSGTVVVTITDDDVAGVNISRANLALREGDSGTYSIVLNSDPAGSVTVTLAVAPDTTADLEIAGSLTQVFDSTAGLTHWSTSRTISVTVAQDGDGVGGTPRVMHTISGSGIGYGAVTVASVVVTVTDDDTAGVIFSPSTLAVTEEAAGASYMAKLRTDPLGEVVVTVDAGSSTTPPITVSPTSLTFNSGNWETNQSFLVTADADGDAIGGTRTLSHTVAGYSGIFGFGLTPVVVTVTDDDTAGVSVFPATLTVTEEEAGADYTVVLDTIPGGDVVVTVAPDADASATAPVTVSPLTLTFTPVNWNVAQSFTVTADVDADAAGGTRTLSHTVVGYTGLLNADVESVEVTVIDNDRATFTFDPQRVPVTEGTSEVTLTAVLSSAIPDGFEVTVSTTGSEASPLSGAPIPGSDYTSTTVTLTFEGTANEMVTFTVAILDDNVAENLEVLLIAPAVDGAGKVRLIPMNPDDFAADFDFNEDYYVNFAGASAMITITDDDTAGVTLSETSLAITEEGSAETYTVVLNSDPDGPVTVTIDPGSSATAPITVDPGSLTLAFDSTNWSAPQTVTVTATEDHDAIGGTRTLAHTVTGYGAVTADSVGVTVTEDDVAVFDFDPAIVSVMEGIGDVTLTAVLDRAIPTGFEVTLSTANAVVTGGTMVGSDFIETTTTLTFAGTANERQMLTVAILNDDVAEGEETFGLSLLDADGSRMVVPDGAVTLETLETFVNFVNGAVKIVITDDDTAGVTISETSLAITEEDAAASYTVVLGSDPDGDVTVTIDPGSSETAPITVTPASLTFNSTNWSDSQTVTVTATADEDVIGGVLTLSHMVTGYGTVTVDSVEVTVTDDDIATLSFNPPGLFRPGNTVPVAEGDGMVTLTAVLDRAIPAGFEVTVSTMPTKPLETIATATEGIDYTLTTATLTFEGTASETQTLTVAILNDDVAEGSETIIVVPVFDVEGNLRLSPANPEDFADDFDVNIDYYVDFSNLGAYVMINDDDMAGVTLSETQLTVTEGREQTYTVVLDSDPAGAVDITIAADTAAAPPITFSPASLSFNSTNWSDSQTVTVTATEDIDSDDGTRVLAHTVTGYGTGVGTASVTAESVMVTVLDNDIPGVTISETTLTVTEGEATATYEVVLNTIPDRDVTVTIVPDTASTTAPITVTPGSLDLTFTTTTWAAPQTVTVSADQDDDALGGTRTLEHTVSGYTSVTTVTSVMVTVTEDDTAGVTISEATLTVTEGEAAGAEYTVVLNSEPVGTVVIGIIEDSSTTPPITVSSTSLSFNSSTWTTAQTVTVRATEDADAADGTRTLEHTVSNYTGVSDAESVTVTVLDNDTPGVTITVPPLEPPLMPPMRITEGEGMATYTVVLDSAPAGIATVTIDPGSSTTAPITVGPSLTLTFNSTTWNIDQIVTVMADQDTDQLGGLRTLSHTVTGYGLVNSAASVEVSVIDNDRATLVFTPSTVTVTEGVDSAVTVMAVLSKAIPAGFEVTATTTGQYELISDAVSGSDYIGTTTTLRFAGTANETETFTVPILDDGVVEGSELLFFGPALDAANRIRLSPANPTDFAGDFNFNDHYYVSFQGTLVRATILSDDTAGVTISETELTVTEGREQTYTVVLGSVPSGNVTVTIVEDAASTTAPITVTPGEGALGSGDLIFTPATWDAPQTVTVAATEDDDAIDGLRTLTHTVTGYGTVVSAADVRVTVTDNDTAGVTITPTTLTVAEGAAETYEVVLNTRPASDVTVTIAEDASTTAPITVTPGTGVPGSRDLMFTSTTWAIPQTVTVTATRMTMRLTARGSWRIRSATIRE